MTKMHTYITVLLLITAYRIGLSSTEQPEWIDPHEMVMTNSEPQRLYVYEKEKECTQTPFSLDHYKRLINFILNLLSLDDTSMYSGHLNLKISKSDFQFLRQFVRDSNSNIENAAVLRKIDQMMSKVLTKSRMEYVVDIVLTWTDYIYFNFYNRCTAIIASCIFLLFISYKLLRANFTLWSVFKYLIFLAWVTDFAFTWINLLKEAEINKLADSLKYELPPYCDPNKMSWFQYLWYTLSTESECRKYHQTIYKDVFWTIAPLQVVSNQLGIIVYTPASYTGRAVGTFVSGMLASLPFGVNVVLLPLLLIFVLLIICILLSFATRTSFGLNICYLLQFHFGSKERHQIENVLSGSNLSSVISIMHRNMIEDVKCQNVDEPEKIEKCACRNNEIKDKDKDTLVTDKCESIEHTGGDGE